MDYGRFDHRRMIECLTSWRDDETGELVIGIKRDGIHTFESLILARYQMNTQVYYHRLRRVYDLYLREYFGCLDPKNFDTPEKIIGWHDIKAMNQLFLDAADPESPGHQWARRIVNRQHHKDVYSIDEGDGPAAIKLCRKVFLRIQQDFPHVDFVEDLPEDPFSIHKIARDDDRDRKLIDFPLLDRGRKTSLGERSQVLKAMPTTFRVGFIFADVQTSAERTKIVDRCRVIRNENL